PLRADFRLHPSDVAVTSLGADLSADADWPFNTDCTGAVRAAPWSIGPSENDAAAVQTVRWVHVGALQPTTASVLVHLHQAAAVVTLRYSTDLTLATYRTAVAASGANNNVLFALTGLTPGTRYAYVVEIVGTVYTERAGQFQTAPSAGSFTFAVSGDLDTGIGAPGCDAINLLDPLFFLLLGDHHYEDIGVNDITLFRKAYETLHQNLQPLALYQARAVDYIWDDHDFAGSNSDSTGAAKPAAEDAYRENVAHYPLPAGDPGQFPIYHSFVISRCRFIVTDQRSMRSVDSAVDNAAKTMLGAAQK